MGRTRISESQVRDEQFLSPEEHENETNHYFRTLADVTTYSGVDAGGKYIRVKEDETGLEYATVSGAGGSGDGASTFLELTDTPSTYSGTSGKYAESTGSGIVWTYAPVWLYGENTPGVLLGNNGDFYLNTTSGIIYNKFGEATECTDFTSDTTTEGYTIGQENPGYTGGAFDNVTSDGNVSGSWYAYNGGYQTTGWTGQDYGAGNEKTIVRYRIFCDGTSTYFPKDWTFEASTTGAWAGEEVVLDTKASQTFTAGVWANYDIYNITAYRYYRLNVSANNGHGTYLIIREMEFLECNEEMSEVGWNEVWVDSGLSDHSGLSGLDYNSSGHTGFAPDSHTHDDRYYTEGEVDTISGSLKDYTDTKFANEVFWDRSSGDIRPLTSSDTVSLGSTLDGTATLNVFEEVYIHEQTGGTAYLTLDAAVANEGGEAYINFKDEGQTVGLFRVGVEQIQFSAYSEYDMELLLETAAHSGGTTDLTIQTGYASSGDSGDINLSTGSAGGTRGNVVIDTHLIPEMTGASGTVSARNLGSSTQKFQYLYVHDAYIDAGSLYINNKKVIEDVSDTINITTDTNQDLKVKTTGTGDLLLQTENEINANSEGGVEFNVLSTNSTKHLNFTNQSANGNITFSADGANAQVQFSAVDEIDFTAPTIDINGDVDVSGEITFGTLQHHNLTGIGDDDHTQYVLADGTRNITGPIYMEDSVVIHGDLVVSGTAYITEHEEVQINDNLLVINYGEVGPGVTVSGGLAGIEVDRGTEANYRFVFDETNDNFQVGEVGDLQPVATREALPTANGVAYWDSANYRFVTVANLTYDGGLKLTDDTNIYLGDSNDAAIRYRPAGDGSLLIQQTNSSSALNISNIGSGSLSIAQTNASGDILLRTGATPTTAMVINPSGNLGIGATPSDSYRMLVRRTFTDETPGRGVMADMTFRSETTGTQYYKGMEVNTTDSYIATGVVNSGYLYGINVGSHINSASMDGELKTLTGVHITSGLYGTGDDALITTAQGVRSIVYCRDGEIENILAFNARIDTTADGTISDTCVLYRGEFAAGATTTDVDIYGLYITGEDSNYLSGDLEIDGTFTAPNHPAFCAVDTSYTIGALTTWHTITNYATEVFDQGANFNPTTGVFTAPVTGKYQFNATFYLQGANSVTYFIMHILTSNRTYSSTQSGGVYAMNLTQGVLADMDAGDTAYLRIYQHGGTASTVSCVHIDFSGFLAC